MQKGRTAPASIQLVASVGAMSKGTNEPTMIAIFVISWTGTPGRDDPEGGATRQQPQTTVTEPANPIDCLSGVVFLTA